MPASKRLLGLYEMATVEELEKGLNWYPDAHNFACALASDYDFTPPTVAAVISCLSPFVLWDRNKQDAARLCRAKANEWKDLERVRVSTFNKNKLRAIACLNNGASTVMHPKAPKTYAFYKNILLDDSKVTIDRHAYKALVGTKRAGGEAITLGRYRAAEAAYKETAQSLGLKGYELQAIVWLVYKRLVNR